MSIRVMSNVWELALPDSEKLVLLALADCANDEGHCWPSMASLVRKCTKGERTIQGAIKALVEKGHITRREVPGKGCNYTLHPRSDCTPAKSAPPQGSAQTPAAAADKPSRTIIKKPESVREREIPDDWAPLDFGLGTKSRCIVDGWPPGEMETQLEHFVAHHRGHGSTFKNWQDAWSTWVLRSRRFGGSRDVAGRQDRAGGEPANALVRAATRDQAQRSSGRVSRDDERSGDWA